MSKWTFKKIIWTEAEEDCLRAGAGKLTIREIVEALTDISPIKRSYGATRHHLVKMGLTAKMITIRSWTLAEESFLCDNYDRISIRRIAEQLGFEEKQVCDKAQTMALCRYKKRVTKWSESLLPILPIAESLYDRGIAVELQTRSGKMAYFAVISLEEANDILLHQNAIQA